MKRKIVMILGSDFLYPHIDTRVFREAKSLVKAGHDVAIISKSDEKYSTKKIIKHEGITVYRIMPRRFINYNWFKQAHKLIGDLSDNHKTILHCHDLGGLAVGLSYKSLHPKKNFFIIYDSHELISELNQPKIINKSVQIIENISIRHIDALIVTNKDRLDIMKVKYPHLKNISPTLILPNYPALINYQKYVKYRKIIREKYAIDNGSIVFLYQGPMDFEKRGIGNIIEAVYSVDKNITLLLVGGITSQLKDKISECELKTGKKNKVICVGWAKEEELNRFMSAADFGITSYTNICLNNYYCAPNKTYEYMGSNLASLGPDFPIMRREILTNKTGFTCEFSSVDSIIRALKKASINKNDLDRMKKKSHRLYLEKFNWNIIEPNLLRMYSNIIGSECAE